MVRSEGFMEEYLEFKNAKCKDCYKCLRECPVKAIKVIDHQAKIIKERCIYVRIKKIS